MCANINKKSSNIVSDHWLDHRHVIVHGEYSKTFLSTIGKELPDFECGYDKIVPTNRQDSRYKNDSHVIL